MWSLVASRDEFGGDLPLLSLSAQAGVRERIAGEGRAASEDLSGYRVVRPGDLVINRLSARDGAYAVSRLEGLVSPAYWVLTTNDRLLDSRWLEYVLRSKPYLAELGRISKFMPPAQFDLPWDQFRKLPVPMPPPVEQRAIADFLDTETARIDALIAKKRRLIEVLEERETALFDAALERRGFAFPADVTADLRACPIPKGWRVARLSVVLSQLTNGYVGPTRDLLVENGVRYVQSLHIKNGVIDFERRPYFVPSDWHRQRPRIHLREGDVLIVQTGDIGQVAVVPAGFGDASCHALQIARVRRELLSGPYLGAYLRCHFGRHSLLARATGALHPHLEGGIRDVPIVIPPRTEQGAILSEIRRASNSIDRTKVALVRQATLFQEHRQALITAAVTGELEMPGVAA